MTTGITGSRPAVAGYNLRESIVTGAGSEVWRGEPDGRPGTVVAIKRIATATAPVVLRTLEREAEALNELRHPNVLDVLDIVADGPHIALVTRFAAGGSLAATLSRTPGGLPATEVADLGARLASALAAAHDAGIIHGGVGPSNVLFDAEGEPLLAHFGAARAPDRRSLGTATSPDPATTVGNQPSGMSSDMYGLAATLYEAITGVPPHTGLTAQETLDDADRSTPVQVLLEAGAPDQLAAIIDRGLHRDPKARFTSMTDMARHLAEAHQQRPSSPAPGHANSAPTGSERTSSTPRRVDVRRLCGAAVSVATILIGVVIWMIASGPPRATPSGHEEATDHLETPGALADSPSEEVAGEQGGDDAPTKHEGPSTDRDGSPRRAGDSSDPTAVRVREPAAPCTDAPEPASDTPATAADVDGRGCTVSAVWNGQVLEVAVDGQLRRFDLDGEPDDVLLFGDFSCDGRETPAVVRAASDEVFVFPVLDPDEPVTVTAETLGTPGGNPVIVLDDDGCAHVRLTD